MIFTSLIGIVHKMKSLFVIVTYVMKQVTLGRKYLKKGRLIQVNSDSFLFYLIMKNSHGTPNEYDRISTKTWS